MIAWFNRSIKSLELLWIIGCHMMVTIGLIKMLIVRGGPYYLILAIALAGNTKIGYDVAKAVWTRKEE